MKNFKFLASMLIFMIGMVCVNNIQASGIAYDDGITTEMVAPSDTFKTQAVAPTDTFKQKEIVASFEAGDIPEVPTSGLPSWLLMIGTMLIALYEIVIRFYPTFRSYSIIAIIYSFLNAIIPDKSKDGKKFTIQRQ